MRLLDHHSYHIQNNHHNLHKQLYLHNHHSNHYYNHRNSHNRHTDHHMSRYRQTKSNLMAVACSSIFSDKDNQILLFVGHSDTLNCPKDIDTLILHVDLIYYLPYLIPLFHSS